MQESTMMRIFLQVSINFDFNFVNYKMCWRKREKTLIMQFFDQSSNLVCDWYLIPSNVRHKMQRRRRRIDVRSAPFGIFLCAKIWKERERENCLKRGQQFLKFSLIAVEILRILVNKNLLSVCEGYFKNFFKKSSLIEIFSKMG